MFRNFQYQLQRETYEEVLESAAELVVVDIDDAGFTPGQVASVSRSKTLLSYLSVGQASSARWYWDDCWVDGNGDPIPEVAPGWLGCRNRDWAGAYEVRYWEPEWQAIVLQGLDRILDAGYAGAVYDVVDAFQHWAHVPGAPERMKALVKTLMKRGRARRPGFIGIPNLGYQLLLDESYLSAISGQLAESVFFSGGAPRPRCDIDWATRYLDRATAAGKQVFVIEYVDSPYLRRQAAAKARAKGYVPYMAMKLLDRLEPVWQAYDCG